MSTSKDWDSLTSALRLQAEIADKMKLLASRSPEIARALVADMAQVVGAVGGSNGSSRGTGGGSGSANFDAVCRTFVNNGNKPLTKPELAEEAGVKESSLHSLLYAAPHKVKFNSKPNPKGGKAKVFSLKKNVFEELQGGATVGN